MAMAEAETTKKRKRLLDRFRFIPASKTGKVAAVWVRVSSFSMVRGASGEREQRASVQTQREDLIKYAKGQGWAWQVYDGDCDVSGAADLEDRPALQQLTKDIQSGKIHTVLVREAKRLFRDSAAQAEYIAKIMFPAGVELKSPFEQIDISTPDGQLMLALKAMQAQTEIIYSADKSMRSKQWKAERGQLRTTPALGYGIQEHDGLRSCHVKEEEAKTVRKIFSLYLSGKSTRQIVMTLTEAGLRTKRRTVLREPNVLRILQNPVYKGVMVWDGKEYPSPFPPIIKTADWEKAQSLFRSRRTGRHWKKNTHLLTGLLKCGYCHDRGKEGGEAIYPNMARALNTGMRNGKRYRMEVYACQTRCKFRAAACPLSINIQASRIESMIADWIGDGIAANCVVATNCQNEVDELKDEISTGEKLLSKLKERQEKALAMFATGVIDESGLSTIQGKGRSAILKQEKETAELTARLDAIANNSQAEALAQLRGWDRLSVEQRKAGLRVLISHMLLYRDRLIIAYAHGGGGLIVPVVRKGNVGYVFEMKKAELYFNKGIDWTIPEELTVGSDSYDPSTDAPIPSVMPDP